MSVIHLNLATIKRWYLLVTKRPRGRALDTLEGEIAHAYGIAAERNLRDRKKHRNK